VLSLTANEQESPITAAGW